MKMQKSERIRGKGRRAVRMAAVLGAALVLIWCDPMVSRAEPTGTVIPSSVNIRKEPSQDSEVIGSTTGGKEISIRGKVDASGVTWYQVYVQGDTLGYVRADMIEKKGDEEIPTLSASSAGGEQETSSEGAGEQDTAQTGGAESSASGGAQVQAQEEMAKQYASIKVASAKVRPDPSTSNNPVESIPSGTQVVVSGKSEGTDSKTWYYVTFTGANGSEKTGYIRSDLLELGDLLPVEEPPAEEPPVEEPEEPEPMPSNDYELRIETDAEGQQVWYICDNVAGKKQKLVPLLQASYDEVLGQTEDTGAIVKQRIVIVVLAVLLAVAVIAIVVMAFKLRDAYYEDYEDEEDDEDEEEEDSDRRSARREREKEAQERQSGRKSMDEEERRPRKRGEDEEERSPRKRGENEEERRPRKREDAEPVSRAKSDRTERKRREVSYEEEPDARETVKSAKGRKAKNFLLDDDEFEFEFLNMDDKDLK